MLDVFLPLHLLFLRQDLSLNLELTDPLDWLALCGQNLPVSV